MQTHSLVMMVCLSIISFTSVAESTVERLFWDKVPLRITLPVGKERLVTFPAEVRLGIPGQLSAKLRSQSHQGTVYWLAHQAFDIQRIEVREISSKRIYLIDLSATKKSGLSNLPIEVKVKRVEQKQSAANKPASQRKQTPGYVALTRFAAQQLYAPARLWKAQPKLHRVSLAQQPLTHLIRGESIKATPLASWQSGSLYVTAVKLQNTGSQFINLDPRALRGQWRTATFQHGRLHPTGSESDTTAVYLISDRPFHEVI